jgi:hypothetical protein
MNADIKSAIESRYGRKTIIRRGVSDILSPDLPTDVIKTSSKAGEGCVINGVRYRSLTEAARTIDPDKLTPTEVRRRCYSKKVSYKDWRIDGVDKRPVLKVSIDGYLFESTVHAHQYIKGMSKSLIENRCLSGNPQYRHWKKLETDVTDMTYEEMEESLKGIEARPIRERLITISCEGVEFYSQNDAAEHFGVSVERIRQKLESDRYTDYQYLY